MPEVIHFVCREARTRQTPIRIMVDLAEDVQTLRERDKTVGVLFIPRFLLFASTEALATLPHTVSDLRRVQYRRLLDPWLQECFGRV
jgi:hypothetical protein